MALLELYQADAPEWLETFAQTRIVQRLKWVGMDCGCEYTSFPNYRTSLRFSRFEHSVGVARIVWHFTGSMRQTVAGLLHDVSTPVFAHVVDFLNGDYEQQASTEADTAAMIGRSRELCRLLDSYGLQIAEVADYHLYTVADNDSPKLSADRLEYTLRHFLAFHLLPEHEIARIYRDLVVAKNEQMEDEIQFKTPETALLFTRTALQLSRLYVSDPERYAMQRLADLLADALRMGVITQRDLYTTEPKVIAKLEAVPETAAAWHAYRACDAVVRSATRPDGGYWVRVPAKKRYINPLIFEKGRAAAYSPALQREMDAFLQLDFSAWLGIG